MSIRTEQWIGGMDFWKSGTGETIRDAFELLDIADFDEGKAINLISSIVSAMKDEYGD